MPQATDAVSNHLLQLGELIQTTIGQLVESRRTSAASSSDEQHNSTNSASAAADLPTWGIFNAQRALLAAAGTLTELVSQPENRLLEVSSQYFEARALHIAADARIPDLLAAADGGVDNGSGVAIDVLSAKVGIEPRKLSRLLRCLCSIHIFREVGPDVFANNIVSARLVSNEPLRAYILLFGLDLYTASDHLPRALHHPVKGPSYAVDQTAWQDAMGVAKPRWDWLEETTSASELRGGLNAGANAGLADPNDARDVDLGSGAAPSSQKTPYPGIFGAELKKAVHNAVGNERLPRPEHAIFSLAMSEDVIPGLRAGGATARGRGGGRGGFEAEEPFAAKIEPYGCHDSQLWWLRLIGGFCLQLSHLYPDLRFVLQDRGPAINKAQEEIWPRENPEALAAGRIQFVVHDFFEKNPVPEADVYWLRYILHDWSDDYCVRILSRIRESMGTKSRILICDQVMNTTNRCRDLSPAPAPLLPNWGYYTRYSHQRDLAMMAIINGIERKPDEFRQLVERAGLRLRKIWDCRSQVGLVEVVLPDSELQ
ncbi:hypothetical protein ACJZ2D_001743 [Fusarium nematophilum]